MFSQALVISMHQQRVRDVGTMAVICSTPAIQQQLPECFNILPEGAGGGGPHNVTGNGDFNRLAINEAVNGGPDLDLDEKCCVNNITDRSLSGDQSVFVSSSCGWMRVC